MSNYTVKKVESKREMNEFIRLPNRIYANCPQYVPDLEVDVRETFDPKKNPGLEFSEIQPFIAIDQQGKTVGRIAGIINHKANSTWNVKNVRFSLIDMIDEIEVTRILFDAVTSWGKEQGMTHIQGPLGISDFDKEGMLVEGFNEMGSMVTIYNHDYYPQHMHQLGFEKEADWVQLRLDIPQALPDRFARVANLVKQRYHLKVIKMNARQIKQGYGHRVFHLLNEAYRPLFGFSQFSERQIDQFVSKFLPLVDLEMVPIVVNEADEFVGAAITMGSLGKALQQSKGRLWPFGWFHLLKALKWKHDSKVEMLLIAVRPDYQGRGVNTLFFEDLIEVYNRKGYTWAEAGPQLENNTRELSQWKLFNPQIICRRRCYIKEIDFSWTSNGKTPDTSQQFDLRYDAHIHKIKAKSSKDHF